MRANQNINNKATKRLIISVRLVAFYKL